MINEIKKYFEDLNKNYEFIFKHKVLIWYLSYWIWVSFQLIILFYILWFSWLSYLSISYSIILFIILVFLFLISIPSLLLFILWFFLLSAYHIWDLWIIWKIILWLYLILIISLPFITNKCFPKQIEKLKKKYKNKVVNFYIKWTLILFILIFVSFVYWTFTFKLAYINTTINNSENWKIFWKYLFYNKDYYFLDICWKKIVIPWTQVKSIEIKTTRFEMNSMKVEDKNKLNKEYSDYCIKNR